MVTKTEAELAEMTPAELKAHYAAEEKIVFGTNFKREKGKPVEHGFGAPGRETENHFAAMQDRENRGLEPKGATAAAREAAAARKRKNS